MSRSPWTPEEFDLDGYLARIGCTGTLDPTLETLRVLHRAHVTAIPFENLEALLGRQVSLELAEVQEKLVTRRRGGWCSEHAVLMAAALTRLGYQVTGLTARPLTRGQHNAPSVHSLLSVRLDDGSVWLVDVGFGAQGLIEPVPVRDGSYRQDDWTFRLDTAPTGEHRVRSVHPTGDAPLFSFTLGPRYPNDFKVISWYYQTHPRSPFNSQLILQTAAADRRCLLVDATLTRFRADGAHESSALSGPEIVAAAGDLFGIELDDTDAKALLDRFAAGSG
ncbi:arylamine N-acetyltransferase family protein [Streptomyces fuscichromogenes]|uniref:arylamine N-acetyltransferase family protein n=1 Tax=Streptomyces fuscichromogenes TaxID=1324013 RepID=UPI001670C27E|nr:arylamine N-acetyltransferase [Streptomyces fuscichromogenes]